MSKEKVEKVEKAACVVGRVRDCVLKSTWFLSIWWRNVHWSPLKWPRGETSVPRAGLRSDRHSQFWGDIKLCLCEAC